MQNTFPLLVRIVLYNIFMGFIGASITIRTIDGSINYFKLSDYGAFSKADSSITFQVQGCDNALLTLHASSSLLGPNYYIIIGGWGNTRSQITKTVTTDQLVDNFQNSSGLLDCYSFQNFWISWQKGRIRVGSGNTLNDNVFLLYDDMCAFAIQEIVISTAWWTTLDWIFHPQAFTTQAASSLNGMIEASYVKISDCPTFEVILTFKEPLSTKGYQYNKESEVCILSSETAINGTLTSYYRLIE